MTSSVKYLGKLRTESIHLKSGEQLISDAPTDNRGRGEAFSPTDLCATSLASCMITIMGIKANDMGFDLPEINAEVTKVMASDPRRIHRIEIIMNIPAHPSIDGPTKSLLEKAGRNCPVAVSLHPDIEQAVQFNWE